MRLTNRHPAAKTAKAKNKRKPRRYSGATFMRQSGNYLSACSHFWFATVQEVLQADWQEAWHSPQPPFAQLSFRFAWLSVLICFIKTPTFRKIRCVQRSVFNSLYHTYTAMQTLKPRKHAKVFGICKITGAFAAAAWKVRRPMPRTGP